jgi:hypothetical protein
MTTASAPPAPSAPTLQAQQPARAEDPQDYYKAYAEYSKTLRTWLVAYGMGAPVLLSARQDVWPALATSGRAKLIIGLFLIGVVAQVVLATLNKASMWVMYYGAMRPEYKARRPYRLAEWLAEYIGIDVGVDIVSMVLFAWATGVAFQVILK